MRYQFQNLEQSKSEATKNNAAGFTCNAISVVAGILVMGNASIAFAQAGPEAGALQQQLQREADLNRVAPPPESLIKKPAKPSRPKSGDKAIEVTSFKVTGITLITQEQAQEVLKPFTNRQLTLDQIKEAGEALTNLYSQMGRMAQAVIPPQDVVGGVITIKII